ERVLLRDADPLGTRHSRPAFLARVPERTHRTASAVGPTLAGLRLRGLLEEEHLGVQTLLLGTQLVESDAVPGSTRLRIVRGRLVRRLRRSLRLHADLRAGAKAGAGAHDLARPPRLWTGAVVGATPGNG